MNHSDHCGQYEERFHGEVIVSNGYYSVEPLEAKYFFIGALVINYNCVVDGNTSLDKNPINSIGFVAHGSAGCTDSEQLYSRDQCQNVSNDR